MAYLLLFLAKPHYHGSRLRAGRFALRIEQTVPDPFHHSVRNMMSQRAEDIRRAEETMRIERHDMRHQLQTVASLAQRGDRAALLDYIGTSQEKLTAAAPESYCSNPVLDAVLVNAAARRLYDGNFKFLCRKNYL